MSETVLRPAAGLAGLLGALQPRVGPLLPPPDLDAIRAAGFADGLAEGAATERAALAPLHAQLAAACDALAAAAVIDAEALRPLLVTVVRQLAEAVLAAELRHDPAVLEALATAALAAIVPGQAATLAAHPDTLAVLVPLLPAAAPVRPEPDPALAADRIIVSGPDFIIDTSLATRLSDLLGDHG
jgi:flagellar biosynthesis/type III secretory pathway protein FliH